MKTDVIATRAAKRDQSRLALLKMIEKNGQGGRLPAERELSESLGVARETLRRILRTLEAEGLLRRKQGAGTFVADEPWVKRFQLISFSEDMRQRGLAPSSALLSTAVTSANAEIAQKLKIDQGASVHEIRRLRLADDEPMALETVYLVAAQLPHFEPHRLSTDSLYAMLSRDYQIELKSATQQICAAIVDQTQARLLNVEPGSPALLVIRQVMTTEGQVVEYGKSLYRADRYRFEVNVQRPLGTRSARAK